jgi:hypothetical protein
MHELLRVALRQDPALTSTRRFADLRVPPENIEIEKLKPVERIPRKLQAVELVASKTSAPADLLRPAHKHRGLDGDRERGRCTPCLHRELRFLIRFTQERCAVMPNAAPTVGRH